MKKRKEKRKLFPSKFQHEVWTPCPHLIVYGHLKIYIEVCKSRVRRVDYVSFLICTDGVHTPGYDPISPEGRL